ncbi:MAG: hexameric tyrosine-coordinated heme protein [Balneolaceae bacterium]
MKSLSLLLPLFLFFTITELHGQSNMESDQEEESELSLITGTPEEGFQVAIQLARKGVTSTQPDKDVLFMLRDVYSKDPDALIASSQVIAIHYQTVAAANNYWRDKTPSSDQ